MTSRRSAPVVVALATALAPLTAPTAAFGDPPLTRPIQAIALLKKTPAAKLEGAVERLNTACRGRLRRTFRDHPGLLGEVRRKSQSGPIEARKAVLNSYRCFSPARFRPVIVPLLSDPTPAIVAYAAEIAARTEDPELVKPLVAALERRKSACLETGLSSADVDVCVWLTYAPGACLRAAPEPDRMAAAAAAVSMFDSPYPKVREVAVETVAAARLKRHARAVGELVKREKSGGFAKTNTPALIGRFQQRRRALVQGD